MSCHDIMGLGKKFGFSEESNLRPLDSTLWRSTTEPQKLCSTRVLFGRVNVISLWSFIRTLFLIWGQSGRLLTNYAHPLGTNYFLHPAFRCHLNKRWRSHTEHSLAQITSALQASVWCDDSCERCKSVSSWGRFASGQRRTDTFKR